MLAIKRVRQWAAAQAPSVNEADLLERVLSNVVGFDLNPLAVISARTNYLLALGDLLQHRRGDITIPVYLADSILTPSMATEASGQLVMGETTSPALSFNTSVGRFSVPQALVSAQYIDGLADLLEECVAARYPVDGFRRRLLAAFPLDQKRDAAAIDVASGLFTRLEELEEQGINGIWARIIKNAFAPLFCGQFDYVAGNPPWVNWANLPDAYRQQTAPLWTRYDLFPHAGLRARLGSAMDDISVLMLYASMDNYLVDGGRLGFVITQTVFKTEGGGAGFRRFRLGTGQPIKVLHVDDMTELQPFEGATNRTAVAVLRKGSPTTYPVAWTTWRKARKGTSMPMDLTLSEAADLTRRSNWVAVPIDAENPASPWATARPRAVSAIAKLMGGSGYSSRAGINGWANGIFWVDVVGHRPDGLVVVANMADVGRGQVDAIQAAVEATHLYPLLRGRDVQRWTATPRCSVLLPQCSDALAKPVDESDLRQCCPKTYAFLAHFGEYLRGRPGFSKYYDAASTPFYATYNVGPYTFAPHKVVWREQAAWLTCAVVSDYEGRMVVPDHKLMLSPFEAEDEAHFVCACLNSSVAQFLVKTYAIETSISTHVFSYLSVPTFDPDQPLHRRLRELSLEAHAAAAAGDGEGLAATEAEIDQLAAQLWGLTDKELRDIQDSLADLRS